MAKNRDFKQLATVFGQPGKGLFGEPTGKEKDLFAELSDGDFPPDIDPKLREALTKYDHGLDDVALFTASPPDWFGWNTLIKWFDDHLQHLKDLFSWLGAVPACNNVRIRMHLVRQWRTRVDPYIVGMHAHLHRIVSEQPEHAISVDGMLRAIMHGPSTTSYGNERAPEDDWSGLDRALAAIRTFIESYYKTIHGRVPLGRPEVLRMPNGDIFGWEWVWDAHDDPRKSAPPGTKPKGGMHQVEPKRAPRRPTKNVSWATAAKWFRMNYRTLQKSVNSGVFAAQKISDKLWCFDLDELARNNPAALLDADPSK